MTACLSKVSMLDRTMSEKFHSICRMCHGGCGVIAEREGDTITALRGDPANPLSRGHFCHKGRASLEQIYHPQRLRKPLLRRKGKNCALEPAEWEEVYDLITSKLAEAHSCNPERVAFYLGTDHNFQEWVFRFANAFHSPNVVGPAHICFYPRLLAQITMLGGFTFGDYKNDCDCILIWGRNPLLGCADGVLGARIQRAIDRGAAVIVVDPIETPLAKRSTYWLQVHPGRDLELALGFIHQLLFEDLADHVFLERILNADDLNSLRKLCAPWNAERCAQETGVPVELLQSAARCYAKSERAIIESGTGINQQPSAYATAIAVHLLSCLSDHHNKPGCDVIWDGLPLIGRRTMPASNLLPEKQAALRLGAKSAPVLGQVGWSPPSTLWQAAIQHDPYPIEALLVFGSNPVVSAENTERVRTALSAIPLVVVSDLFLTPTAQLADVVLPVSHWLERDQIVEFNAFIAARQHVVESTLPSDEEIILNLSKRLGLGDYFWKDLRTALDARLAPLNLDWPKFVEERIREVEPNYKKKQQTKHFRTRDGKVRIPFDVIQQALAEPRPQLRIKPSKTEGMCIAHGTNRRSPYYFNSEQRNLRSLRRREATASTLISRNICHKLGIADDDWIATAMCEKGPWIITRAKLSGSLADNVIVHNALWWEPEAGELDAQLACSLNCATSDDAVDPYLGTTNLRANLWYLRRPEMHEIPQPLTPARSEY